MFGKAIDARPDDHAALYNAGVVCEALGDYVGAMRYYERAEALAEDADYQQGLARVKLISTQRANDNKHTMTNK